MEIIPLVQSFIYLAASSLLVPVLFLLVLLTVWMVMYTGRFSGLWLARNRLSIKDDAIALLRCRDVSQFPRPVREFVGKLSAVGDGGSRELIVLNLLRETEHRLWKSLDSVKILIRIGPGLGLIGTLIPMGTGLAALGQGDMSRLSGDLVVAFTTTVVGMALGLLSYFFFTIQRRWLEEDIKNMELAAELFKVKP